MSNLQVKLLGSRSNPFNLRLRNLSFFHFKLARGSPDDRHKPRKPKQEEQHQNDINIDVAASSRRPDEEQTSAAVAYPSMGLGQNRDVVGQTNESQAASGPMHPSAIEHISLAPTQLSRHHSAPLSRDPSVAGQLTTSVARSHAGYPQASINQPEMYRHNFSYGCNNWSRAASGDSRLLSCDNGSTHGSRLYVG
ncbi:uncharacterized protein IWZ02DRAFT_435684 [Phyllosticta citriasiana]|uniref:uncharacterized protein n=1 Tax=Phyllosticta citriasiana TaxID=595635 RepID=UPI0030FD800D